MASSRLRWNWRQRHLKSDVGRARSRPLRPASDRVPPVPRTLIADLPEKIGEQVTIRGWVQAIRDQKSMQFVIVRDEIGPRAGGATEAGPAERAQRAGLSADGGVGSDDHGRGGSGRARETGRPGAEARGAGGRLAGGAGGADRGGLGAGQADRLALPGPAPPGPAADLRGADAPPSTRCASYWRKEGFIELHTPKFMGSASESGAELFKVEYFDGVAYLAQSPQFYKQMAMAAGFGKVFEVGPVFRANPSFTSRHDTEFTSVDVEISWIDSHEEVMAFEERWLAHVLAAVKDDARRADRLDVRHRADRPDGAVPESDARARQGAAARARARRARCGS